MYSRIEMLGNIFILRRTKVVPGYENSAEASIISKLTNVAGEIHSQRSYFLQYLNLKEITHIFNLINRCVLRTQVRKTVVDTVFNGGYGFYGIRLAGWCCT